MYLKNLDERELMLRGNIFKHCTLLLCGMLLLSIMLKQLSIIWAPGIYPEMIMLAVIVMVVNVQMIHHEIYQMSKARLSFVFGVLGVTGAALITLSILDMVRDGIGLLEGSGLSSGSAGIITGLCYVIVCVYDLAMSALRRRVPEAE